MEGDCAIYPVILCGGGGTRLWPVSRPARPKPFLPLLGEDTLFEQTVARLSNDAQFEAPVIVAGDKHVALIAEQMGATPYNLIIEPEAKNTAPAIALAAARLPADAIMLVCPSDHHIADAEAFRAASRDAALLAARDYLVALGITPDRAETGYGYIRAGSAIEGGFEIAEFVEKPDEKRARSYLESGDYSWNGGIFALRAGALLEELARHRPAMARSIAASVENGREDGVRFYPEASSFAEIEGDSIDYAVMEKTRRAAMVPARMGWSDIGNWAALHDALERDEAGNATQGRIDLASCSNTLAISDGPRVSAVGLKDVCIVVSGNEVLVTVRGAAHDVGRLPGANGNGAGSKDGEA
jgi:mannose-1-phosphate guanylyltransferase/mannose-1-phosphate guanylyltransferase/mannose-6-phosphate isomerase